MSASVDSMFSVRDMPWWIGTSEDHGQAKIMADYPQTWDEARKLAGLDWEPQSEPVYALDGIGADGQPVYQTIDGWQRVARSDTGATLALTQETYKIIGHEHFGEIFDAVTQQPNVKAETGGSLEGGKKVWMLVRLDEPVKIPGDKSLVLPYAALTSRHDAKGATVLRSTAVRIVCANTFRAAEMEGDRTGTTFSFIHRGNWRDRLVDAREAIMGVKQEIRDWVELSESLLAVKVTPNQQELFVRAFIPSPPEGLITDRVAKNIEEARQAVRLILDSKTVDGAGIGGTAYGLVQASGEYLDHVRRSASWETKLGRTIIRPEPLKAKAMALALDCAKN